MRLSNNSLLEKSSEKSPTTGSKIAKQQKLEARKILKKAVESPESNDQAI